MKIDAQKLISLVNREPAYCEIQRNAILHHRNQMRFIAQLMREGLNKYCGLKILKSHAQEIKTIFKEIEFAARRA